jgi:hypothetical protein
MTVRAKEEAGAKSQRSSVLIFVHYEESATVSVKTLCSMMYYGRMSKNIKLLA